MFKKVILTALLIGSVAIQTNAQGFYVKAGLGFNFKSATTSVGSDESYDAQGKLIKATPTATSYGKGFGFNVTPGYMFNEFVGAELDMNFVLGGKSTIYNETGTTYTYKQEAQNKNMLFLAPSLIISAGGEGKVKPYARFGAVLPLGGKVITTGSDENTTSKSTTKSTMETTFSTNLGFVGGLGLNFAVSEKISLYGELVSQNLATPNKKSTYTEYERVVNGVVVSKLADWKTFDKETSYVKELTSSSNSYYKPSNERDMNTAREQLRENLNLSYFGLRFGMKVSF